MQSTVSSFGHVEKWDFTAPEPTLHLFPNLCIPTGKERKKKMPPSSQRIPYEASATKRKDEEAILNPVTTNVFGELSPLFLIN